MDFEPSKWELRGRYWHRIGQRHDRCYDLIECGTCARPCLVVANTSANKGRFCSHACASTGSNYPLWRGADGGYRAMHSRVERERGKAAELGCVFSQVHDRHPHDLAIEWANLTGNYGDVNDYAAMCKRCHIGFDGIRGEGSASAKLTDEKVRECRQRHAVGGESCASLAREFGVSSVAMGNAVKGVTWKHVPKGDE